MRNPDCWLRFAAESGSLKWSTNTAVVRRTTANGIEPHAIHLSQLGGHMTTDHADTAEQMNEPADSQELSRRLVYLAAERTLSSWIRTALSLMALGFVIDRFGLILHRLPHADKALDLYPRIMSTWGGSVLIGMGVAMALAAGVRYLRFSLGFHYDHSTVVRHGLLVGAIFAMALAVFGAILIALLFAILK